MYARVTRGQGAPAEIDEGIRRYREELLPSIQALEGFKGNYTLVDRDSGRLLNVTLWETEQAVQASAAAADAARAQVVQEVGGDAAVTAVETYEVVIQPAEDEGQRLASAVAAAARELEGQMRRLASSEEVGKLRRQVETSFRAFEDWARRRGSGPDGGAS